MPVVVWAIVIFLFSNHPSVRASSIQLEDFVIKKTAHMIEYAIFTILVYRAFLNSNVKPQKALLLSFLVAILYAASDEFHQSFTPGREPTVRDVIFDTIGSVLAINFIWKLLPKAPKRLKVLAKNLRIV